MTELRTRMAPVEIDKACSCTIGRMRPTGVTLTVCPPIYPHECNRCGRRENYKVSYPYITYEVAQP